MANAFGDLKARFKVSIGLISALSLLIYFSNYSIVLFLLALVAALFSSVAMKEAISLVDIKVGIDARALIPLSALLVFSGYISLRLLPVVFFLGVVLIAVRSFDEVKGCMHRLGVSSLLLLYISFPLGLAFAILHPSVVHFSYPQDGRIWFLYLILITKGVDLCAYFVGKQFGKRLMTPKLSPKKTWEGAVGATVGALVISLFFGYMSQDYWRDIFELPWINALIFGLVAALFGQFGDLIESMFKRDAKVKDSSAIPGLGGVLDIIDSILLTIPVFYFYIAYH